MIGETSGRGAIESGSSWTLDGPWAAGQNTFAMKIGINPPAEIAWAEEEFFSDHPGGASGLFCDGAARFLNDSINLEVLAALCTRDCGELISDNLFD